MDVEDSSLIDLEEDLSSILLRYGLYFGAIFQLVCVGACIFLPNVLSRANAFGDKTDSGPEQPSLQNTPKRPQHRNRKQEKKKRR